jgi:hypothetical protein
MKNKILIGNILFVLFVATGKAIAQTGLPQIGIRPLATPQFRSFSPIGINGRPTNQPQPANPTLPNDPNTNYPMGATANEIIRQTQENTIRVIVTRSKSFGNAL